MHTTTTVSNLTQWSIYSMTAGVIYINVNKLEKLWVFLIASFNQVLLVYTLQCSIMQWRLFANFNYYYIKIYFNNCHDFVLFNILFCKTYFFYNKYRQKITLLDLDLYYGG